MGLGELFSFVAKDLIHPPLFYLILKVWMAIGGEGVFWLRLLPVAFSALAIFPFVSLARELKLKTSVIQLALFLMAVNGALIKYTQTLRMYSMLMFLSLVSMWLFARYFNRGKSFVWLVIANILLVYTHYFGWLIVGTEVAILLWFQRIKWRRMLVMFGITLAAFIPWLIAVVQSARAGSSLEQNIGWQTRPGLRELIVFVTDLVEPFYYQASNAEPTSIYTISTPLLLVCITAIVFYASEWADEQRKEPIYLLLAFVAIPLTVAFAVSWLSPHSVWGTRHLIMVLPVVILLIANSIMNTSIKALKVILLSLVVALAVVALAIDSRRELPNHVWCAWNDVAGAIQGSDPRAKTIYTFENLVAYHMWFALRSDATTQVNVVKGLDVMTDDETYFLPRGFDGVKSMTLDQVSDPTIWLVFRTQKDGDEVILIDNFKKLGYLDCYSYRTQYGVTTVHWVQLTKTGCK